jgi:outer membrane protein OmpA-like peptidoglycan-associated protein
MFFISRPAAFVLFFLLLCSSVPAQEPPFTATRNKKAEFLFGQALQQHQMLDYSKALSTLDKCIKLDPEFVDAWMLIADIHGKNENYGKSIEIYEKVKTIRPEFPLAYFSLANDAFKSADYERAYENIEKYLQMPDYFRKKNLAERIRANAAFAKEAVKNPVKFDPYNLGSGVNTHENEYFPGVTADEQTLIFTRLVGGSNEEFYLSHKNGNAWGTARNLGDPINTEQNEGTVSLSADGQYIFFTACNRETGYGHCDLLLSRLDGDQWLEPKYLNPPVNGGSWESQPSISFDGKTLYFSSERAGGFGKTDIWYTTYKNGRWTPPVNCGPEINTAGSEQSPFIAKDDQTLYFNSDGHPGMGGIDLYMTRKGADGRWSAASNLGYPINTQNDETCLIIAANGKDAFIAAEKEQGYGGLDIYGFELYEDARPRATGFLRGVVYDAVSKKKLAGKVELIDLVTGKTIVEANANKLTGEFLVCLQGNHDYALNVSNEGYLFYSENISLKNQPYAAPQTADVPLYPIVPGAKIVLKNIFFETDKFNLKDESKVELDKLYQFLTANPKVKVEIGGHTDNTGDKQKNIVLSNNRARAVYDYLVKAGIPAARLTYKGYADTQPIADNKSAEGKAKNRRTEFKILQ